MKLVNKPVFLTCDISSNLSLWRLTIIHLRWSPFWLSVPSPWRKKKKLKRPNQLPLPFLFLIHKWNIFTNLRRLLTITMPPCTLIIIMLFLITLKWWTMLHRWPMRLRCPTPHRWVMPLLTPQWTGLLLTHITPAITNLLQSPMISRDSVRSQWWSL